LSPQYGSQRLFDIAGRCIVDQAGQVQIGPHDRNVIATGANLIGQMVLGIR
jgi:hypothetical protein